MPASFLDPRATWADPLAYDRAAHRLAAMFAANFEAYADGVTEDVRDAGPRVTPDELEAASEGLPGDGSPLAG